MAFRLGLACLNGIGQIASGLAILFSLLPRLAALLEATMLTLFAFLAWSPDTWFASTRNWQEC
jgi:uncharacterized membrane protein YphA (DoxX/SURF4 family)